MLEQDTLLNKVAHMVGARLINTTLSENEGRIDVANLKNAHEKIESGRSGGKIILARALTSGLGENAYMAYILIHWLGMPIICLT